MHSIGMKKSLYRLTTCLCLMLGIGLTMVNSVTAQDACFPNTCMGSNAYMKIGKCLPGTSGCMNADITYSEPITCDSIDCKGTAEGNLGCQNVPLINGTCGAPQTGRISCCSNSSSPTSVPPTPGNPGDPTSPPPTEYDWAYITVTVYDQDGNLQAPQNRKSEPTSGANVCKGYGFAASSTGRGWDANGNCQNTWLLDMARNDKSMNISGINTMYTGCSVTLNGSVILSTFSGGTCSVASRDYNKYNDSLVIRLQKVPPTLTLGPQLQPPTCSKNSWPTSISATGTGTFSVTGTDPDSVNGTTTPNVEFYFTKQLTNYCIANPSTGNAVDGKWQKLGETHTGNLSALRALNNATLKLPAGTYMMTTNLRDNDNQFSTGNPGTPQGCGFTYNGCSGTFTIGSTPTITIAPPGPTVTPPLTTPTAPPQQPFSVQVNIWEGTNCSNTSTPVASPFAATIVAKLNGQTSGTNHAIAHTLTIPGLIPGQTSTFGLTNLPQGWSLVASCSGATISRQYFSQGPVDFHVEQAIGPWWQSAAGDIYGFVVESAIPAITNGFLSLKMGLSDPGVFLWGNSHNIPHDRIRQITPPYRAKDNPALAETYAYFEQLTRDFEKVTISVDALPPLPTMAPNRQATFLKKLGDLDLNSSWGASRKLVVFVDGNLRINANQNVPVGSYLHFIVKGNIAISGNVTDLQGMYSADGSILIEASTNPFVSKGSVVSFSSNGVESRRSLSGVGNNTQAATVFEYRPDLVINTPREMRRTDSTWSEIAPD